MHELYGKTLLIVGLGGIGQAIATRAAAFAMRVWGSRRHPQPTPGVAQVVSADGWQALLPEADYVVLALPLTPDTRQIINAKTLRQMRPHSYLINIARGGLVDEAALAEAVQAGVIGGAALDTLSSEPLPPDSPLWALDTVFISPHCAWASPQMRPRSIELFLTNLERYRAGQPLHNIVRQDD
jgi:phosphoglycerate dehydrogenase-like enzyme